MIGFSSFNSLISNISVPITFNFPPRCKCAATLTNVVMVSLDCKPKLILKIFDGLIVDDINENDQVFQKEDSRVIIDNTSLQFLEGAEIDFCEELIGSSFKINNPNATSSCGCGTSFSFSPSFK